MEKPKVVKEEEKPDPLASTAKRVGFTTLGLVGMAVALGAQDFGQRLGKLVAGRSVAGPSGRPRRVVRGGVERQRPGSQILRRDRIVRIADVGYFASLEIGAL